MTTKSFLLLISALMLTTMTALVTAQTATPTAAPAPTPTPTLSPRGMERIFQSLRVRYGFEINSRLLPPPLPDADRVLQAFAQRTLGAQRHMPYSSEIYTGSMAYDPIHRMLRHITPEVSEAVFGNLIESETLPTALVGMREDGMAVIYGERCPPTICATPDEYAEFLLRTGALGVYVVYGIEEKETYYLTWLYNTFPVTLTQDGYSIYNRSTELTYVIPPFEDAATGQPMMYNFGFERKERHVMLFAVVAIGEESVSRLEAISQ